MSLMEREKNPLGLFLPISLLLSELSRDLDRKLELPFGFKDGLVRCHRLRCGSRKPALIRLFSCVRGTEARLA